MNSDPMEGDKPRPKCVAVTPGTVLICSRDSTEKGTRTSQLGVHPLCDEHAELYDKNPSEFEVAL